MTIRFALPLLVAAAFAMPAAAQDIRVATMNLQGTGTVTAAPDMATLTTGVVTQADTARDALTDNTAAMAALMELVESAGIAETDVQTSNFSIQPRYVNSDKRDADGYRLPPRIIGYQVSNTLTVRVRDLDGLGALLDQMVTAGSNTIQGISFEVADSKDLVDQARREAMTDVMAKADLYAEAADVCLERIVMINENGGYMPQPQMMRAMAADAVAESVPVAGGEVGYTINVSVEWELGQGACAS